MSTPPTEWEFDFEEIPSEHNGCHILDDIPELLLLNELNEASPTTDRVPNQEAPNDADIDDIFDISPSDGDSVRDADLLNATRLSRISESSRTTFRSTAKSDALHSFLFPLGGATPTKSPLRRSTRRREKTTKRRCPEDQSSVFTVSSTSSSSGTFQAVSTSYSSLKKSRKTQRERDGDRNRRSQPLRAREQQRDEELLSFDSNVLSAGDGANCSSVHSLRWPPHIFSGNSAICIRLKGVYHPASIEAVSSDYFVLKMATPTTGTVQCVRFRHSDYLKDSDRVIAMVDAAQLTQTQSQSQREHTFCRPPDRWQPAEPLNASTVSIAESTVTTTVRMDASNLSLSQITRPEEEQRSDPPVLSESDRESNASDDLEPERAPNAMGRIEGIHGRSRRRSQRLLNKRKRDRVRTVATEHPQAVEFSDDEELGIVRHSKIRKKRAKRKEYRVWGEEEESALIRAFRKHRRRAKNQQAVFRRILEDPEFERTFSRTKRTAPLLREKWKRLDRKLKLTQKWNAERKSNGKSEDDASD